MIRLSRLALACALVAIPSMAAAQDIVVMRKMIEEKPAASTIGLPTGDQLVGASYGWYSACFGGQQYLQCVGLAAVTGAVSLEDNSSCLKTQNAAHAAYVRAQSLALFGSDIMVPAGPAPADDCSSGVNQGWGYMCTDGNFGCLEVDRKTGNAYYTTPDKCTQPAKDGFDAVFARYGLTSGGTSVNPATQCLGGTVYGRTESCGWKTGADGVRSVELQEGCFAIDATNLSASAAPISSCRSSSSGNTAARNLRTRAGLLDPAAAPTTSCTGGDTGVLTTQVISDEYRTLSNGYHEREINTRFWCKQNGADVPYYSACDNQMQAWEQMSMKMAQGAGPGGANLAVGLGGPRADEGVWQEVFTEVYW